MLNKTRDGKLKVHVEQQADATAVPTLLASGYVSVVPADTNDVAALQEISASADADGIALLQAPSSGVPLSLTGAAASLVPSRFVTLTSTADLSGVNFAIVGTNGVTETIAGPDNNTVTTTVVFPGVASITPDDTSVDQLSAGWPNSSDLFPLILGTTSYDPSRRLSLTSANDFSSVDFTLVGTDTYGDPLEVTIAGPNNSTVATTEYFATLTSITPDTLVSGSISAGWLAPAAVLYQAPEDGASLSHFFLVNNNVATQTVSISLLIDGVLVPMAPFELQERERASVLQYEPNLPLPADAQVRVDTTTDLAISYLIHGTA